MMKNSGLFLGFVVLFLLACTARTSAPSHPDASVPQDASLPQDASQSLVPVSSDATSPKIPQRIISTSPNLTELLDALGKTDRLIANTQYCTYPPPVQQLPHIGDGINLQVEKILTLQPDLMIMLRSQDQAALHMRHLNIPVVQVGNNTVEEILESIQILGTQLGAADQANVLYRVLNDIFNHHKDPQEMAALPSVVMIIHRDSDALKKMMAIGGPTYLNDLIRAAGGRNVFADNPLGYPEVSVSTIIQKQPDIILETHPEFSEKASIEASTNELWKSYTSIPAVQNHRVYVVIDPVITIPSQRIQDAWRILKDIFRHD